MVEEFRGGRNSERFIALATEAFNLEKQAAMLLENRYDCEPSRSILFKNAAGLALVIFQYDDAIYLANRAFDGNLDKQTTDELDWVIHSARTLKTPIN